MAGELATYDRRRVSFTVGPDAFPIIFETLSLSRDADDWSDAADADARVVRNKINDLRGSIVVTVSDQQQESNSRLESLRVADTQSLASVFNIQMVDNNGQDFAFSGRCWILKPPDMAKEGEATAKEWTIRCTSLELINRGLTYL